MASLIASGSDSRSRACDTPPWRFRPLSVLCGRRTDALKSSDGRKSRPSRTTPDRGPAPAPLCARIASWPAAPAGPAGDRSLTLQTLLGPLVVPDGAGRAAELEELSPPAPRSTPPAPAATAPAAPIAPPGAPTRPGAAASAAIRSPAIPTRSPCTWSAAPMTGWRSARSASRWRRSAPRISWPASPLDLRHPALAMVLEGVVRSKGARPRRQAAPAVPELLRRLLPPCIAAAARTRQPGTAARQRWPRAPRHAAARLRRRAAPLRTGRPHDRRRAAGARARPAHPGAPVEDRPARQGPGGRGLGQPGRSRLLRRAGARRLARPSLRGAGFPPRRRPRGPGPCSAA